MIENWRKDLESWAKMKLQSVDPGHDWWHIERVLTNAKKIANHENGDWQIIETAVLLHDLPDPKFFDERKMLVEIKDKLSGLGFTIEQSQHVLNIIKYISFSKQWEKSSFDSAEFRIVQDADRLDAIGAIGIARAFSYGGHKGRPLYDPYAKPQTYTNSMEYRAGNGSTINHFYEKLLLLKDLMKTDTGKAIADERHRYMKAYLLQFFSEIGE